MNRIAHAAGLVLFATVATAALPAAAADSGQVAMSVEVPPGQYRGLRLKNLPKGVRLAVAIQAPGRLGASLLNEADYARYPKTEDPVYAGSMDRRMSFMVTIPQTGHYFLVFDNRAGGVAQKVKFVVRGERKPAQQPADQSPPVAAPPSHNKIDRF
jgi:hypothetical protein